MSDDERAELIEVLTRASALLEQLAPIRISPADDATADACEDAGRRMGAILARLESE